MVQKSLCNSCFRRAPTSFLGLHPRTKVIFVSADFSIGRFYQLFLVFKFEYWNVKTGKFDSIVECDSYDRASGGFRFLSGHFSPLAASLPLTPISAPLTDAPLRCSASVTCASLFNLSHPACHWQGPAGYKYSVLSMLHAFNGALRDQLSRNTAGPIFAIFSGWWT